MFIIIIPNISSLFFYSLNTLIIRFMQFSILDHGLSMISIQYFRCSYNSRNSSTSMERTNAFVLAVTTFFFLLLSKKKHKNTHISPTMQRNSSFINKYVLRCNARYTTELPNWFSFYAMHPHFILNTILFPFCSQNAFQLYLSSFLLFFFFYVLCCLQCCRVDFVCYYLQYDKRNRLYFSIWWHACSIFVDIQRMNDWMN